MNGTASTNPTFVIGPVTTTAAFVYGEVTVHITLPTPADIASQPIDDVSRKLAPSLRRALGVALEDLG